MSLVTENMIGLNEELNEENYIRAKPICSTKDCFMLVEPKVEIDVRDYQGEDYLDLLLCDEENLNEPIDFVKRLANPYSFGKTYDFNNDECVIFPRFDYKLLDSQKIEQQKKEEALRQQLDEANEIKVKVQLEEEEEKMSLLEKRLSNLNKKCELSEEEEKRGLNIIEELSNSEKAKESPKKYKLRKRNFGNLLKLSWLKKRNDKNFKGKRNLRESLLAKGVDLSGNLEDAEEDYTPPPMRFAFHAKRNLREGLNVNFKDLE